MKTRGAGSVCATTLIVRKRLFSQLRNTVVIVIAVKDVALRRHGAAAQSSSPLLNTECQRENELQPVPTFDVLPAPCNRNSSPALHASADSVASH
jgi:hypothetical protein